MVTENQDSKPQALQFPIVHSKCPVCGCEEDVVGKVKAEELAKGKGEEGTPMMMLRAATPVAELATIMLGLSMVPMLTFDLQACANPDCGALYFNRAERNDLSALDIQKMLGLQVGAPGLNRQQRRHTN